MAVFVGTIEYAFDRMKMFHLVADNLDQLHQMVDKIGISRRWFQNTKSDGIPHYDICKSKKVLAIQHGAIELNDRQILDRCWKSYPDSLIYKLRQQDLRQKEFDHEQDNFNTCDNCDGHDACRDFGCAFKLGLGKIVQGEIF